MHKKKEATICPRASKIHPTLLVLSCSVSFCLLLLVPVSDTVVELCGVETKRAVDSVQSVQSDRFTRTEKATAASTQKQHSTHRKARIVN